MCIGSVMRDKWKRGAPESEYHEERRSVRATKAMQANGNWCSQALWMMLWLRVVSGGHRLKVEGCRGHRSECRGNEWHAREGERPSGVCDGRTDV
jgi:hypothetical protein